MLGDDRAEGRDFGDLVAAGFGIVPNKPTAALAAGLGEVVDDAL